MLIQRKSEVGIRNGAPDIIYLRTCCVKGIPDVHNDEDETDVATEIVTEFFYKRWLKNTVQSTKSLPKP